MSEPALTPEEWAAFLADRRAPGRFNHLVMHGDREFGIDSDIHDGHPEWHEDDDEAVPANRQTLAAICLYGRPYGFTWAHVESIRALAEEMDWERNDRGAPDRDNDKALEAAALIANLLPPRTE